jgi:hypothetical protein
MAGLKRTLFNIWVRIRFGGGRQPEEEEDDIGPTRSDRRREWASAERFHWWVRAAALIFVGTAVLADGAILWRYHLSREASRAGFERPYVNEIAIDRNRLQPVIAPVHGGAGN